jgi:hypothetical protein
MSHASLVLAGFAFFYTCLAFWFPLGDDFPSLWSLRKKVPNSKVVFIHALFLCAFLSLIWLVSLREHSFAWLARGPRPRYPGVLQVFFVAAFMGVIERLWLSRSLTVGNTRSAEKPREEAPEQPGAHKRSE